MTSDELMRGILSKNGTIAVVGMSRDRSKAAHRIPMGMKSKGYTVIPVNPTARKIAGMKCYPTLTDIPENVHIDIVNVFRPSDETPMVVERALERHESTGDVDAIWLQLGIENREAKDMADAQGIPFVQDECIWVEYRRLFSEDG